MYRHWMWYGKARRKIVIRLEYMGPKRCMFRRMERWKPARKSMNVSGDGGCLRKRQWQSESLMFAHRLLVQQKEMEWSIWGWRGGSCWDGDYGWPWVQGPMQQKSQTICSGPDLWWSNIPRGKGNCFLKRGSCWRWPRGRHQRQRQGDRVELVFWMVLYCREGRGQVTVGMLVGMEGRRWQWWAWKLGGGWSCPTRSGV